MIHTAIHGRLHVRLYHGGNLGFRFGESRRGRVRPLFDDHHPVGASELPQHRHSGLTGAVFDLPRIGTKIGSERCAFCRRRFNIGDDQDGPGPWSLRARAQTPGHKKESCRPANFRKAYSGLHTVIVGVSRLGHIAGPPAILLGLVAKLRYSAEYQMSLQTRAWP